MRTSTRAGWRSVWLFVVLVLGASLATAQEGRGRRSRIDRAPKVGDVAPDFDLELVGVKREEGKPAPKLKLSSLAKQSKPVVLAFGSFTWGPFCGQAGRLEELAKKYGKKAEFVFVYIREAHPKGEEGRGGRGGSRRRRPGQVGGNGAAEQPTTLAERRANAEMAVSGLKLSMKTVLDDMKDKTATAYSSHPDRLFIVQGGKIAYAGARGPRGYDLEEMAEKLEQLLSRRTY